MRAFTTLISVLCVGQVWAFDASTVRSVSELDLMNEKELSELAAPACFWRVKGNAQASRYFDTIGLVARKKNAGKMPSWHQEMLTAIINGHEDGCSDAAMKFSREYYERMFPDLPVSHGKK